MTTILKNNTSCSASSSNINEIGNSKINSGNNTFSNIKIEQDISFNLTCLSDDKVFN
jgi:hypothetical protein